MTDSAPSRIHIDKPEEGILRFTLDNPPVNALGREVVAEFTRRLGEAGQDPTLRVVLIAARGENFCAGADLKERRAMEEEEAAWAVQGIRTLTETLAAVPVPTIAVIQGAALGGGFELALACDMRVASRKARVGFPECSLAIIPGAGGTQRLARLVGPALAKKWIFLARVGFIEEALVDGLVDEVVEEERLEWTALELAREIGHCGPVALRAAKWAIDRGLDAGSMAEGLKQEWEAYQMVLCTKDRREALDAFAEKRKPRFEGK